MTYSAFVFKVASEPSEFEQIHRLNYQTFVEEIPQHPASPSRWLIDKFHAENTYVIASGPTGLAGMIAVRDQRPFSLDAKIEQLDSYLPPHAALVEVRLLAIAPQNRRRGVLGGLLLALDELCQRRGYDLAVMSGTVRQLKLYRSLRWVPFGPRVGTSEAPFQPMYLTLADYQQLKHDLRLFRAAAR
jgi:hypothetical protein